MPWYPAYVGLGSNLGDSAGQVRRAMARLAQLPRTRLVRRSSLYGSKPMGPIAQPDYCNAVAGLLTELDPVQLLAALRDLERELGREPPRQRWGPRMIDLDLLVHAEARRADPELTLPHPGIAERNFVLRPLLEVAPELTIAGLGPVKALAERAGGEGLWTLA